MRMFSTIAIVITATALTSNTFAAEDKNAEKPWLKPDPRAMKAWQDMGFGMFIHWGPNCLKGQEIGWSRKGPRRGRSGTGSIPLEIYDNLYKSFNPEQFNARQWAQIAKDAGMKYMVITSKHHDGFSMFDSKLTQYDIMSTPFGRDVIKELSVACKKTGIRFGVYYSPRDWYHPEFGVNHDKYLEFYMGQLKELVTNYDDLLVIWFDGFDSPREWWKNTAEESFEMLRGIQPGILLNNRGGLRGDFDTPEQHIGGFNRTRPWETCMTICGQWSWKPNDRMKSLEQCIQTLLYTVGGDGNLLFNVGPMPDGRIEPRQVERLKEMGEWLAKYGKGVYGTRGGPFKPRKWGVSTCKDKNIYLFIMKWSTDDTLFLPPIDLDIRKAESLTGGRVKFTQTDDGISISLPKEDRGDIATVVRLKVDGDACSIPPPRAAVARRSFPELELNSLAFGKKGTASNVFQKMAKEYGPAKAFDDDESTRWATDWGTSACWLEVDLGEPRKIGKVMVDERQWNRVREFQLQYKVGNTWKTILNGTTLGWGFTKKFNPVTARHVRLNILKATEAPTIWEFRIFGVDDK